MQVIDKSEFKPVKIEIILESESELLEFSALFSTVCVSAACPHIDFDLIWQVLEGYVDLQSGDMVIPATITDKLAIHKHILNKVVCPVVDSPPPLPPYPDKPPTEYD